MHYEFFETPQKSLSFLIDIITEELREEFEKAEIDEELQALSSGLISDAISKLKKKKAKDILQIVLAWVEDMLINSKYWNSKLEINTCCSHSECGSYQKLNSFLRERGIEPSIAEEDDHVCFKINLPKKKEEKRKFIEELDGNIMNHEEDDE